MERPQPVDMRGICPPPTDNPDELRRIKDTENRARRYGVAGYAALAAGMVADISIGWLYNGEGHDGAAFLAVSGVGVAALALAARCFSRSAQLEQTAYRLSQNALWGK